MPAARDVIRQPHLDPRGLIREVAGEWRRGCGLRQAANQRSGGGGGGGRPGGHILKTRIKTAEPVRINFNADVRTVIWGDETGINP